MLTHKRPGSTGFTLIELLVVIAIIAILAAILFPVFAQARKSAHTAACISNLKQFGLVLSMFREDHNGRNPGIWDNASADDYGSFFWLITSYAKTKLGPRANNIYKCPSAPWLKQIPVAAFARAHRGYAYTMNETGWTDAAWGRKYAGRGIKDADVVRPKELIFIADQLGWVGYGIGYTGGQIYDMEDWTNREVDSRNGVGWTSTNPPLDLAIPLNPETAGKWGGTTCAVYNLRVNHAGGANFLFYDGHVKTMKMTYGKHWVVAY